MPSAFLKSWLMCHPGGEQPDQQSGMQQSHQEIPTQSNAAPSREAGRDAQMSEVIEKEMGRGQE